MLTAPPPVANGGLGIRRDYGLSKDGKDQSLSRNRKCELRRGCPIQRLNWCWAGPRFRKEPAWKSNLSPWRSLPHTAIALTFLVAWF